jgi:hypothetical protein
MVLPGPARPATSVKATGRFECAMARSLSFSLYCIWGKGSSLGSYIYGSSMSLATCSETQALPVLSGNCVTRMKAQVSPGGGIQSWTGNAMTPAAQSKRLVAYRPMQGTSYRHSAYLVQHNMGLHGNKCDASRHSNPSCVCHHHKGKCKSEDEQHKVDRLSPWKWERCIHQLPVRH